MTNGEFRRNQASFYMLAVILGMVVGIGLGHPLIKWGGSMLITSSGLLIPSTMNLGLSLSSLLVIGLVLLLFMSYKTNKINVQVNGKKSLSLKQYLEEPGSLSTVRKN